MTDKFTTLTIPSIKNNALLRAHEFLTVLGADYVSVFDDGPRMEIKSGLVNESRGIIAEFFQHTVLVVFVSRQPYIEEKIVIWTSEKAAGEAAKKWIEDGILPERWE